MMMNTGILTRAIMALAICARNSFGQAEIKGVMEHKMLVPMKDLLATTLEITLPPKDLGLAPHNHSGPFIGYVDEGELLFQVEGHPLQILPQGSSLYGEDGEVHLWCANPSKTKKTRFVVTILGRPGDAILTPLPGKKRDSYADALKKAVRRKKL